MRARDFFELQPGSVYIEPFKERVAAVTPSFKIGQIALAGIFEKAYGIEEINLLGDPLTPLCVEDAQDFLSYRSTIESFNAVPMGLQLKMHHSDTPVYKKLEDTTHFASERELVNIVDKILADDRAILEYHSANLLARLLVRAHSAEVLKNSGKKISPTKHKELNPAHMVMQSIHECVPLMKRELEEIIYMMTIETDSFTGEMLKAVPSTVSPFQHLPNWLSTHTTWTEPMNNAVCKGLLELDAYGALLDWVDTRGKTYLPILAPAHLESNVNVRSGNNTNADLILCDITSSKIVPIQVKKSVVMGTHADYKKGMIFVTSSTLGIVEPFTRTARKMDGYAYTAHSARTRYGYLAAEYFLNSDKTKREEVFAKSRQHLDDILGPVL